MTLVDYSGVRADGAWLERAGSTLFRLGLLAALGVVVLVGAIAYVVVSFIWTMGQFGS